MILGTFHQPKMTLKHGHGLDEASTCNIPRKLTPICSDVLEN